MDLVDETLREWRAGSFSYGRTDCMLSIGHYLARTGHLDITDAFAGSYDTHDEAEAVLAANGGMAGLMVLVGGTERSGTPIRGDVLEVVYRDGDETLGIGGLCTGDSVALRLERGVVELRLGLIRYRGVWHGHR